MPENIASVLMPAAIALLTIGLGAYMAVSGNVSLLHSYHYANVSAADRPKLARQTGAALIVTGVGIGALAATGLVEGTGTALAAAGLVAGLALLLGSIVWMLLAIMRYNGALIAYENTAASASPRKTTIIGAAIGALVAALVGSAGVYMLATGDVSLLHSYHYESMPAQNIPTLALAEGWGIIVLAVGTFFCFLAGSRMTARPAPGWAKALMAVGCALWVAGLATVLIAIPVLGGSLAG